MFACRTLQTDYSRSIETQLKHREAETNTVRKRVQRMPAKKGRGSHKWQSVAQVLMCLNVYIDTMLQMKAGSLCKFFFLISYKNV